MPKRIITITSGKGGVGKTTLAVSLGLALSRYGSTVLIDQDFETSSIRSFLDMPFPRDLYHFITQRATLRECICPLPKRWDYEGRYSGFGVVAAPRHFIEELGPLKRRARDRFVAEVNSLPADFVLLDMRAGLGHEIVESMPYSNSGILIFTPRLPAATGAAAHLIKAQIFRKLQIVLRPPSPLVASLPLRAIARMSDCLHRADDVYDDSVPNLDHALAMLFQELGSQPAVQAIERTLATFKVHYVLNHFDGVEESYEHAVKPFIESLVEIVSARLQISNLGWVELNPEIHEANCRRIPPLLYSSVAKAAREDRVALGLGEIEQLARSDRAELPEKTRPGRGLDQHLDDQLERMKRMFSRISSVGYVNHFQYIASAAHNLIRTLRKYNFGDVKLLRPEEVQQMMLEYQQR